MCKHCSGSALRNRGGQWGPRGGRGGRGGRGDQSGDRSGDRRRKRGDRGDHGEREKGGGASPFLTVPTVPTFFTTVPTPVPAAPTFFLQGSTYLGPQEIPQGRLQTGAGFSQDLSHRLTREILTAPLLLASQPQRKRARALSQPAQYNASSHLPRPRERKVRPRPLPCQS